MTKLKLSFVLLFCIKITLWAQLDGDCFEHQYIVQLQKQDQQEVFNQRRYQLKNQRCIHRGSNIYLLEFDPARSSGASIIRQLSNDDQVLAYQPNCKAQLRNGFTDDPLSEDQWSLERIGVTTLWEVTKGAVTMTGDTIVVAIFDSGFDPEQEDLVANVWQNKAEIDNDGLDNDDNGYIDDVFGLNLNTLDDDHASSFHGTAVAGIIGAERDNDLGIAGIAGSIKMMLFSEAVQMDWLLEGLYYCYEQRKLYNESNGEKGAFVVATNYSLGFDMRRCANFPLFDLAYDSLGTVGILSVGATPNQNWNIDQVGDVPSGCASDYLISVTNTTEADVKEELAGFGAESIDLGAPGDAIVSSFPDNEYKNFGGTSGAAPHVAGAIALLYSSPCEDFNALVKSDPALAAREIRRVILEGVEPIASLNQLTTTGGRLNVWNSFILLAETYGSTSSEFSISKIYPNPSEGLITLDLDLPEQQFYLTKIYTTDGRLMHELEIPGFCLNGEYELDLTILEPGFYFLSIMHEEERITRPIIIL